MRLYDAYPPEPSCLKQFATRLLFYAVMAALLVILAVIATLGVANAQTSPPEIVATTIDLSPLAVAALDWGAPIALTLLTTLAAWAFKLFRQKTGWQIDGAVGGIVDKGLSRAVEYAAEQLTDRAAGGIPIDLKNQALATAANYAIDKLPNSLKHFGIDIKNPLDPKLAEMIESRLLGWLVDPEVERAEMATAIRRFSAPIAG